MSNQWTWPTSLLEAVRYFSDPDNCQNVLVSLRWPDGVTCPTCGSKEHSYLTTRRLWKCKAKHPKQMFSIKIGSIFEDSPLRFDKWLVAVWLIVNCKNGISSYEVARDLKVHQQTAWFMLHRIRKAMQRGSFEKLGGMARSKQTKAMIGGLARFMHKDKRAEKITGTGGAGKELVMGLLDRETGKVRVKHVANRKRRTLQEEVTRNVEPGAEVFTDELASYTGLDKDYVHQVREPCEEYVAETCIPTASRISGPCSSAVSREPMSASSRSICFAISMSKHSGTTSARAPMRPFWRSPQDCIWATLDLCGTDREMVLPTT